jgi:glycerol kinase
MTENRYILSLDQGTTSSRALLIDNKGRICAVAQKEIEQIFPQPGWVEHDPMEIWSSQYRVAKEVMGKVRGGSKSIAGIGITNQRETTILWDRKTGISLTKAIVWQDRRTSEYCDELKESGLSEKIQLKTGLLPDAYFSATKVRWILDNMHGARQKAERGDLAFGTVDTWLIWKLTGGSVHATDATNASRTMLFNINDLAWDEDLLDLFNIPPSILPEVKSSSEIYGETAPGMFDSPIPICGIAGDQQAALFGQMCISEGMIKNTYGTGCFIMMNTGEKPIFSKNNLLTTIGWVYDNKTIYALEGSIFIGGAVVQWLRDGLKIIGDAKEVEKLAGTVEDNGGVYLVPAFTGLGAPYWDQYARGTIVGITRGTTDAHIARAALESIAYQTKDVLDAMLADSDIAAKELRVDGGASVNRLLMQFQSDILGLPVIRPNILETTAMGAGFFAGLATGFWKSIADINSLWQEDTAFHPNLDPVSVEGMLRDWNKAVDRSKSWSR